MLAVGYLAVELGAEVRAGSQQGRGVGRPTEKRQGKRAEASHRAFVVAAVFVSREPSQASGPCCPWDAGG